MRYESLLEESKDITFREDSKSIEARDRSGNLIYTKNVLTGFERFMHYDASNRLVNYSDSRGKTFERTYDSTGRMAICLHAE